MVVPKAKKLASGNWNIMLRLGGQNISITRSTEKACTSDARVIKAEYMAGRRAASCAAGDMTLYDAYTRYIEAKEGVLSPSTIAGYRRLQEHTFQGIMQLPIRKLTPELIQREVSAMSKAGKSPKSVANAVGLITPVLRMQDPGFRLSVTLPQREHYERLDPKEEDVAAIARAVKGYAVELPTLLAMWLGLRMSEILGLKWTDIEGEYLHVQRAKVDEGEKSTKTYFGDRWLHLPPYIKGLLDAKPHKGEYIFPVTRGAIYEAFQKYTKRAGIQHYRFHDLRHLNTTLQLLMGIDNKSITKRNGWASDTMIRSVYGHTSRERMDLVTQVIDDYFTEEITKNADENADKNL